MARILRQVGCGLLIALFCCQCDRAPDTVEAEATAATVKAATATRPEPILPVMPATGAAAEKLELGKLLYHETALSGLERQVSCATCHPLDRAGTTGITPEAARTGDEDPFDIPTIFNTGANFAYFWNGRAQSMEGVIQASIRAENIMGASWGEIVKALDENEDYRRRFERLYPETGITEAAVENALAEFVRSLATPNAAFDRWLAGEPLAEAAREGYAHFKELGCVRCHQGAGAGGNMFASFERYIKSREAQRTMDLGRFNVTHQEAHRYQFKVPSLRNIALTAPYFHDGSAATLDEAVRAMALHQLSRTISDDEVRLIVAFLESLTGRSDGLLLGSEQAGATE